jgi:hypothetical protein
MRFLLLLSALLASLSGMVSGTAAAATQVEASQTVGEQADRHAAQAVQRFADAGRPRTRPAWHVADHDPRPARPLYADRLRE